MSDELSSQSELSPQLKELMAAERERPAPPAALRDQLWAGLAAQAPMAASSPVRKGVPKGERGVSSGLAKGVALKAGAAKLALVGAAVFGVGAASGVLVDRTVLRPRAPAAVQAPMLAPAAAASVEPAPTVAPLPVSPAPAEPIPDHPRAPARSAEAVAGHDGALSAERALLDRARTALGKGDFAGAYAAASQHERVFRRGQLIEEREVLMIQALVGLGRRAEGEKRAALFKRAFPESLLLPAVEGALK